jgi:hypothetical protein
MSFFQQHLAAITTRRPISSLSYANRTNYSSGSGKRSYQFGERNGQTNDIERGYGIMEATSVGGLFVSARIALRSRRVDILTPRIPDMAVIGNSTAPKAPTKHLTPGYITLGVSGHIDYPPIWAFAAPALKSSALRSP